MTRLEWKAKYAEGQTPIVVGVARCHHVHEWPVVTCFMRAVAVGVATRQQYSTEDERVVEPANCPICGERFDEVDARYFTED